MTHISLENQERINLNELKEVLSYNKNTGSFFWTDKANKSVRGKKAGTATRMGLIIKYKGIQYAAGRIAWFLTYGEWPRLYVEQINKNKDDYRISNLRENTRSNISANIKNPRFDSSTQATGVFKEKGSSKYRVKVRANGVSHYLGRHTSIKEAYKAYIDFKSKKEKK